MTPHVHRPGEGLGPLRLRTGTSGYAYREWRGKFYPEKIRPKEMLSYYAERFPAVEINSTFYRLPSTEVLESWLQQVPAGFIFAFKAPALVTHRKRLRDAGAETVAFLDRILPVGDRLGPVLFQLPPTLRIDLPLLADFLSILPHRIRAACEFRHSSWLDDRVHELLRSRNAALCISDREEAPRANVIATADFGYLRLRRGAYSDQELHDRLAEILGTGWREAFVFFRHEETASGPGLAARMARMAADGRGEPEPAGGESAAGPDS